MSIYEIERRIEPHEEFLERYARTMSRGVIEHDTVYLIATPRDYIDGTADKHEAVRRHVAALPEGCNWAVMVRRNWSELPWETVILIATTGPVTRLAVINGGVEWLDNPQSMEKWNFEREISELRRLGWLANTNVTTDHRHDDTSANP